MAQNFQSLENGISLVPQSTDPVNPQNGDLYCSDGTVRAMGLWQYQSGAWAFIASGTNIFADLVLTPQSSDPASPVEGEIFRSDGTTRAVGLWEYRNGQWQQFSGLSITAVSANYSATVEDNIILVNASIATAPITITLPSAVGIAGKVITVIKTDSNTVTGTVYINAVSGLAVQGILYTQNGVFQVVSDGANWNNLASRTRSLQFGKQAPVTVTASANSATKFNYQSANTNNQFLFNVENANQTISSFGYTSGTVTAVLTVADTSDMAVGDPVILSVTGGTLPTGLTASTFSSQTIYYIQNITGNTFKLSTTVNGTALTISSAGSGTATVTTYFAATGPVYYDYSSGHTYTIANNNPNGSLPSTKIYAFNLASAATVNYGYEYTNNGAAFENLFSLDNGSTLIAWANGAPTASGTLTFYGVGAGINQPTQSYSHSNLTFTSASYGNYVLATCPTGLPSATAGTLLKEYTFTLSGSHATIPVGTVYTSATGTFTVITALSSGTGGSLVTMGTSVPQTTGLPAILTCPANGTLTVTYSAVTNTQGPSQLAYTAYQTNLYKITDLAITPGLSVGNQVFCANFTGGYDFIQSIGNNSITMGNKSTAVTTQSSGTPIYCKGNIDVTGAGYLGNLNIDSVQVFVGDRVLLINQNNNYDNGVYIVGPVTGGGIGIQARALGANNGSKLNGFTAFTDYYYYDNDLISTDLYDYPTYSSAGSGIFTLSAPATLTAGDLYSGTNAAAQVFTWEVMETTSNNYYAIMQTTTSSNYEPNAGTTVFTKVSGSGPSSMTATSARIPILGSRTLVNGAPASNYIYYVQSGNLLDNVSPASWGTQAWSGTSNQIQWQVPAGVTSLNMQVLPNGGGGGGGANSASIGSAGGSGALPLTLNFLVTPGQYIYVNTGFPGKPGQASTNGYAGDNVSLIVNGQSYLINGGAGGLTGSSANTVTTPSLLGGATYTYGGGWQTPGQSSIYATGGASGGAISGGGGAGIGSGGAGGYTSTNIYTDTYGPNGDPGGAGAGGGGGSSYVNTVPARGGIGGPGYVIIQW